MNTPFSEKNALLAWVRSIPLALIIPVIIWMLVPLMHHALYASADTFSLKFFLSFTIPVAVHFLGYLFVGVPLFVRFYRDPDSRLWRPFFALGFGSLLGLAATCVFFTALSPSPSIIIRDPKVYLIGAGYGLVTAFAAYLQRPKVEPLKNAYSL